MSLIFMAVSDGIATVPGRRRDDGVLLEALNVGAAESVCQPRRVAVAIPLGGHYYQQPLPR